MVKPVMKPVDGEVTDVESKPAGAGGESLADLAAEATMLDTSPERAANEQSQAISEQLVQSNQTELLGLLMAVRAMAFPILAMAVDEQRMNALGQVWNDSVLGQSAAAGAAVMEKHGWTMGGAFDRYGCYVMLAAAVAPPIMLTKKILEAPKAKAEGKGAASGQQQQA